MTQETVRRVAKWNNFLLREGCFHPIYIAVDYLTKDKNCNLSKTELKPLLAYLCNITNTFHV